MALTISCPSCERKLLVPDELLGRSVRCPDCRTVFAGEPNPTVAPPAPPAPPPPAPPTVAPTPNLTLDDTRAPAGPAEPDAGVVSGFPPVPRAEEGGPDLRPCPLCGERIRADAVRCRFCGEDVAAEDDRPWERPYRTPVRRDCEPHRGPLLLTLGIISLVLLPCWMFSVVGLPLGIVAWVLGQKDERKIRAGTMDPAGLGLTQAGKVCGIVGTALNGLYVLGCGAYIAFVIYIASTQP